MTQQTKSITILKAYLGNTLVTERQLTEDTIRIGRLSTASLVLEDASVARMHALVQVTGAEVVLHDLGSTGGTRVNGTRVTRATLRPGDRFQVGVYTIELQRAALAPAAVTPAPTSMPAAASEPEPADHDVVEVTAFYNDRPQVVRHLDARTLTGRPRATTLGLLALGLAFAIGGTVSFGAQVWSIRRQAAQQVKMKEFVKDHGLSERFVPRIHGERSWELAASAGFVAGLGLILLAAFRLRDERRRPEFTVGEDPACSFATPTDALGASRFPLVSLDGEAPVVRFTDQMEGTVCAPGGEARTLRSLAETGEARPVDRFGTWAYPLPGRARCDLRFGVTRFHIGRVAAGEALVAERADRRLAAAVVRPIALSTLGTSLVVMGVMLLAQLRPADAEAMERDSLENRAMRRVRAAIQQQAEKDAKPPEAKKPEPTKPTEKPDPKAKDAPATAPRDERITRQDPGTRGAGEGQTPIQSASSARNVGIAGMLTSLTPALGSLLSRHSALSSEAEDSLGALIGTATASSDPMGLLNPEGGRSGGPSGYVGTTFQGWGSPNPHGRPGFMNGYLPVGERGGVPGVPHRTAKEPQVLGDSRVEVLRGLDRDTVRRIIQTHLAELKFCYVSVGLPGNPGLQGMVKATFLVAPMGNVLDVALASTLGHPATEQCIKDAIRRWRFPRSTADTGAAKGGQSTHVIYPFHFRPAGR